MNKSFLELYNIIEKQKFQTIDEPIIILRPTLKKYM